MSYYNISKYFSLCFFFVLSVFLRNSRCTQVLCSIFLSVNSFPITFVHLSLSSYLSSSVYNIRNLLVFFVGCVTVFVCLSVCMFVVYQFVCKLVCLLCISTSFRVLQAPESWSNYLFSSIFVNFKTFSVISRLKSTKIE